MHVVFPYQTHAGSFLFTRVETKTRECPVITDSNGNTWTMMETVREWRFLWRWPFIKRVWVHSFYTRNDASGFNCVSIPNAERVRMLEADLPGAKGLL